MATRHFLLTHDNTIEEFSEEQASRVADGTDALPRFADKRLHYVQVDFDDAVDDSGELRVRTLSAIITFDDQGRKLSADNAEDDDSATLTSLQHDACVQLPLKASIPEFYALN